MEVMHMERARIIFDSSCFGWSTLEERNLMVIRQQEIWLNDLLRRKGYVYLNEIYEAFGVKWNPKDQNDCIVYTGVEYLEFETFPRTAKNDILIVVLW